MEKTKFSESWLFFLSKDDRSLVFGGQVSSHFPYKIKGSPGQTDLYYTYILHCVSENRFHVQGRDWRTLPNRTILFLASQGKKPFVTTIPYYHARLSFDHIKNPEDKNLNSPWIPNLKDSIACIIALILLSSVWDEDIGQNLKKRIRKPLTFNKFIKFHQG